jgi:ABC-2 type transport system ATP-binding protein
VSGRIPLIRTILDFMSAISFQSITKSYSTVHGSFNALDQVTLDVEEGEFFGLLGPNGAGKTTLISILAGLTKPSGGRASVLGHDVQVNYAQARSMLGVVPQELVFDPFFNVRETLRIQSGYFGVRNNDAWIDELLNGLGLADKADSNMRQLSGGMKRRVLVAQALVHKPRVRRRRRAAPDVMAVCGDAEPPRPYRIVDHTLPGRG